MVDAFTADLATALKEKDPDKLRAVLPVIVERIDYDGENIKTQLRVNSFVVRVDRHLLRVHKKPTSWLVNFRK